MSSNGSAFVVSSPQGGPKTAADLSLISVGIGTTVTSPVIASGPGASTVPEPSSSGLMALGASLAMLRRRRPVR